MQYAFASNHLGEARPYVALLEGHLSLWDSWIGRGHAFHLSELDRLSQILAKLQPRHECESAQPEVNCKKCSAKFGFTRFSWEALRNRWDE
jgi:hypothetical protein